MDKKKKTFTDRLLTMILILAMAVFCYAGYQLFHIFMEYREGTEEYRELAQMAVKTVDKTVEETEITETEEVQEWKEDIKETLTESAKTEPTEHLEKELERIGERLKKEWKRIGEHLENESEITAEKEADEKIEGKVEEAVNVESAVTLTEDNRTKEEFEGEIQESEGVKVNTEEHKENDKITENDAVTENDKIAENDVITKDQVVKRDTKMFQCLASGMQQLVKYFFHILQGNREKYAVQAPIEVDFEILQEINPDIVGWIYVEAMENINYPIVQGEDNEKYLHTTYEGKYNFAGTLFIDENNSRNFQDSNTIVYGHNMKNGSMFGTLKKFVSELETYEKSRYFWILTPEANYRYEIIAAYTTALNSDTYTLFRNPGTEFLDYLKYIQKSSVIETNVRNLSVREKVVTLSTCTGNDATRFVVQGVRVNTVY